MSPVRTAKKLILITKDIFNVSNEMLSCQTGKLRCIASIVVAQKNNWMLFSRSNMSHIKLRIIVHCTPVHCWKVLQRVKKRLYRLSIRWHLFVHCKVNYEENTDVRNVQVSLVVLWSHPWWVLLNISAPKMYGLILDFCKAEAPQVPNRQY